MPLHVIVVDPDEGSRERVALAVESLGHAVRSVKTLDDAELASFNKQAANIEGTLDHVLRAHPALGRLLRIEYQDIAADGGLRHPRWDRWEDE